MVPVRRPWPQVVPRAAGREQCTTGGLNPTGICEISDPMPKLDHDGRGGQRKAPLQSQSREVPVVLSDYTPLNPHTHPTRYQGEPVGRTAELENDRISLRDDDLAVDRAASFLRTRPPVDEEGEEVGCAVWIAPRTEQIEFFQEQVGCSPGIARCQAAPIQR